MLHPSRDGVYNPVSNVWYCHYLWNITEETGLLWVI